MKIAILLTCMLSSFFVSIGSAQTAASDIPNEVRAKSDALPLSERLPPKIQKIQKELPAWIQKGGDKGTATALMQKLQGQMKAKNFEEADKTADSLLVTIGGSAPAATQGIPDEARKKVVHDLGGSFLVLRNSKVQEELKLTLEQKEKLEQHLQELHPGAMKFFQNIQGLRSNEREKELKAYRQKENEKLAAILKETLDEGQRKRLRQLELQKEGLVGNDDVWKDLQITDEQRKLFMSEVQQTQKKIAKLTEEARKGGKPDEIRPKAVKLRADLQGKLEPLLTEVQKTQWKEMLGKPMDLADLFDEGLSQ